MKKICHGCLSIKNNLFPFTSTAYDDNYKELKGNFIDQEGCGVDGEDYLQIFYCPVCGKSLKG